MHILRLILFILFILFFHPFSQSQQEKHRFRNISTLDGLSQNWVRCIYQDSLGFMWFGTADGLNRYDGYGFRVFLPDQKYEYRIGNMFINKIEKKSEHELWICTQKGVYSYDQNSEKFYSLKVLEGIEVNDLCYDSNNTIWFGATTGLFKYNTSDSSILKYESDKTKSGTPGNKRINCIYKDSKNNLWLATESGLDHYDRNTDSFTSFNPSDNLGSNFSNKIWDIIEDKAGRLWIGVLKGGLLIFNYSADNQAESRFDLILKGSPNALVFDNDSNLWIGNGGGLGLQILNAKSFRPNQKLDIITYFQSEFRDDGINSNSISSLYNDKLGDIWVGTYGSGIDYYSKRTKKFNNVSLASKRRTISSNLVNSILEEEKYLWIGTENGLDRIDKPSGNIVTFKHDKSNPLSVGGNAIYKVFKDSRGNLWIGSWNGGLSLFDYRTGTFKNYLPGKEDGRISDPNVFSIAEDKEGNLWVGTIGGGLNKFNYKTKTFINFKHNKDNPGSLNGNITHHVFVSSKGQVWVSLYKDYLDLYDERTNSFKHFVNNPKDSGSISPGFILSVFEDSKGNIWVASNMGLNLFNPENNTFRHFTTENGLPNNSIQGILEDSKGNLWLSTNKGLAVFYDAVNLPKIARFRIYTKEDGLPGDEFTIRAAFKNSDGLFYFGTSQGYTWFNPDSIKDNLIPPPVVITGFLPFDTKQKPEEKAKFIIQVINHLDEITLPYTQSDFIFSFAALNYLNTSKNQYKYRLDGYESRWHYASNPRFASYTNIQPGEYTFVLYGSNNDGVWSENPKTIRIIINPPWWNTILFKIVVILVIIIVIYSILKIRTKILEEQKKTLGRTVAERTKELMETNSLLEEKSEEIAIQNDELSRHRNNLEQLVIERTLQLERAKLRAEESDRLKSAFLANMSHEIRTPMNAILGFSNLLDQNNLSEEEKSKFIKLININGETLMVLVDDILDISLIESNQLLLTNSIFNASNVFLDIEEFYIQNNTKNIQIEFVNKEEPDLILELDKVRFWQILNNLVNNAYKYTDNGSIKFGFEKMENELLFSVSDTGPGIEAEHFERIFNHFNKIENKNRKFQRGAGIGLAICKSLVTKMGGKIWVESKVGIGSVFYFSLPNQVIHDQIVERAQIPHFGLNLHSAHIVIAEDEPANFELLNIYLKNSGVQIFWAKNGKECVDYIRTINNTDGVIILMDIKMPVMDGYEALAEIKKMTKKIPVIAVTAYAQMQDKEKILRKGFDEYIAKPVKKETLFNALSKFESLL